MKRYNQNTFLTAASRQYKPLAAALLLAGLAHTGAAQAAFIPAGTVLQFTAGATYCAAYNAKGKCIATDVNGTYFSMDTNGDGTTQASEKTPFAPGLDGGIVIGVTQDTNGHASHGGLVHTGVGGIDSEWSFFGQAGMVFTRTAITDLTGSGTTRSLNFSGWTVTWNAIPVIPMGGDTANYPTDPTVATINCFSDSGRTIPSVNCAIGNTFTLTYRAHVPKGDISGFGGVYYGVNMMGAIAANTPPVAAAASTSTTSSAVASWTPGATDANGDTPITCAIVSQPAPAGQGTATVSSDCSTGTYTPGGFGGPSTSFTYHACDLYGCGAAATVSVTVSNTPPPVCRADSAAVTGTTPVSIPVLSNDTDADGTIVASTVAITTAAGSGTATANADGTVTYTSSGGSAGTDTFKYTVRDNDGQACTAATVTVTVTPVTVAPDLSSSTQEGCSLTGRRVSPVERADWWLVAGFLAWLGTLIRRKRHS